MHQHSNANRKPPLTFTVSRRKGKFQVSLRSSGDDQNTYNFNNDKEKEKTTNRRHKQRTYPYMVFEKFRHFSGDIPLNSLFFFPLATCRWKQNISDISSSAGLFLSEAVMDSVGRYLMQK